MRRCLFIAAFFAGVVGGCYLRPSAQPGFRYTCDTDADCPALDCSGTLITREVADGLVQGCETVEVREDLTLGVGHRQTCVAGLCEYTCEFQTFREDCPPDLGLNLCFNGVCANVCGFDDYKNHKYDSNDDFCTDPQTCIPVDPSGIDPVAFDALGIRVNNMPIVSSGLPRGAGVCGLRCDAEGAPACPAGQYCSGAMCMPDCTEPSATPCEPGSTCVSVGELSSCLVSCDPAVADSCELGEVCVPGFDVCQPTCLGVEAITCPEAFACDPELAICIPIGGPDDTGDSESSGTATE